jgi:hypothetical protein
MNRGDMQPPEYAGTGADAELDAVAAAEDRLLDAIRRSLDLDAGLAEIFGDPLGESTGGNYQPDSGKEDLSAAAVGADVSDPKATARGLYSHQLSAAYEMTGRGIAKLIRAVLGGLAALRRISRLPTFRACVFISVLVAFAIVGAIMPPLVSGAVETFALSLILAYAFLRMRCRGIGPPFGPRAQYWAAFIVVGTAVVAAAVGLLIVVASHHSGAAYAGLIVPGGLWFTRLPPHRDREMMPRTWTAVLTLPFSRLYDRMGDDMENWCDIRIKAAAPRPQYIAGAVEYYWHHMNRITTDQHARGNLDRWRESITHKITIVRLIDLEASPARMRAALAKHPSTQHIRKYNDDDLLKLADRLQTEALNELHLFLTSAYRLGCYKMLVYPFRPGARHPSLADSIRSAPC